MLRVAVILSVLYVAFSVYGFQAVKTLFKSPIAQWAYMGIFCLIWVYFLFKLFNYKPGSAMHPSVAIAGGVFFSFFILSFILSVFMLCEDVVRLSILGYDKINGTKVSIPSRRKFISAIGLGIAALPFGALLYGMVKGKYNFKVLKYTMEYDDLPDAFDGYQITQISDVHSGSFDNHEKVAYAIDLINQQKSDVLLFTGDMVNNEAVEMEPWKDLFATIEAKDGKFSVLGNHDYGDYIEWDTPEAKAANLEDLKNLQKEIGFDLLLNESRYLQKGNDRIALIGVENWGKGGFKKAGDLQKAKSTVNKEDFKILMSHDPSHWEAEVIPDEYHYHLTLSGHTHGMQFGIEIPGWFKWSPVKWRYKQWAGIYEELGQYINVNRGFGFLGYPGRFGIWPEITVITLKKKSLT
jgi:predicted MPP superfamily phosphohydrolase